jgi:hypothetical protein
VVHHRHPRAKHRFPPGTLNSGNVQYCDMVLLVGYVLLLPAHRRPARSA